MPAKKERRTNMGASYWSDNAYDAMQATRKAQGVTPFAYSRQATRCHDKMDPKGALRESRDSATHPESLAIGVVFDETGSMGDNPRIVQEKLKNLMNLL